MGKFNDFTGEDWAEMLTARPELSSFQDWQTLDIDNWEVFFRFRPEFVRTEIDTKTMRNNIEVLERINFVINYFENRKKNFETHLVFQNLENVVKKHEHKIEIFKMCIERLKKRHNALLTKMQY